MISRGGRGDRTGRYGNTNNDHNFRDMDYRGYDQEDEETETDRQYGCDEQSPGVCDFQNHPGFQQRGDGRKDLGGEVKGIIWPPSSQPQPGLGLGLLHRGEREPRREFEQLRTGLQERAPGKDGRGFPETAAPLLGSRDGNWGRGGGHPEQMEYNTARQREEDKFSHEAVKRRVSHNKCILFIDLLEFFICNDVVAHWLLFYAVFSSGGRGAWLWEQWSRIVT